MKFSLKDYVFACISFVYTDVIELVNHFLSHDFDPVLQPNTTDHSDSQYRRVGLGTVHI